MSVRASTCGIAVAVVAMLLALPAGAEAGGCTPKASASPVGLSVSFDYRACNVDDIDQVRATAGSFTGLPNDGFVFCVPTSAIDWMTKLAHDGFVTNPPKKDWTKPQNFNAMSALVNEMAGYMGTSPTGGTVPETKALTGIDTWFDKYGKSQVTDLGAITTEKLFVTGNLYTADPVTMAFDAVDGALVMPGVSFFNSNGVQKGGHYVALKEASGNSGRGLITFGVRDPFQPTTDDTVQSPYATDQWSVSPAATPGKGYAVSGVPYQPQIGYSIYFNGYLSIEPKKIITLLGAQLVLDPPLNLNTSRPIPVRRFTSPGRRPIVDAALAPDGVRHPFLVRGSRAVWQVNRVNGRTTKLADGPAGASHLAFGGPAMTLFVAGSKQLVALDRAGKQVGSAPLSQPLDALAFNSRTNRLVGLSAATKRLSFFTTDLRPAGGMTLPASFASEPGLPSLAVGADGAVLVHRDGSQTVSSVDAGQQARAAATFPAATLRARTLRGATKPRGLDVDDQGHLFVAVGGRLVELDAQGNRVRGSAYTGMPAGSIVRVDRSFSNKPAGTPPIDYMDPELLAAIG